MSELHSALIIFDVFHIALPHYVLSALFYNHYPKLSYTNVGVILQTHHKGGIMSDVALQIELNSPQPVESGENILFDTIVYCLLYTSPSPRDCS